VLFANEAEICSLYEVDDFDAALQQVRRRCRVGALTRSEQGSVVIAGEEVHVIDADPVDRLVDTTGAGDQYAAGFLYGLTHGHDLATCGHLGSIAAAEVISHFGPRPAVSLAELAERVIR
jgi:sugar/nucleoside kinase (ribokinase family)